MKALIASGAGAYGDPWHPFAGTSARLAAVLTDAGFSVTVDDDVDGAMTRLDGVDLLAINAGDPWNGDDSRTRVAPAASILGLRAALDRGIGVLAMHSAVSTLRDHPDWAPAIGAVWVPGASWHPDAGDTRITGGTLPGGARIDDFTVSDERYCRLQRLGESDVVATHEGPDRTEPTAWVRRHGAARVAVDVLGHDERSYESAGHRALIAALARWAAGV